MQAASVIEYRLCRVQYKRFWGKGGSKLIFGEKCLNYARNARCVKIREGHSGRGSVLIKCPNARYAVNGQSTERFVELSKHSAMEVPPGNVTVKTSCRSSTLNGVFDVP